MNRKVIYLAARYSRRLELCGYREELRALGFIVQARWLDGKHQLDNAGTPIGGGVEQLIEAADESGNNALRAKFADDDFQDVCGADIQINFTEPPRSNASRGGRHVELGMGLLMARRVIVVGYRENIFHWLPKVEFAATWPEALARLQDLGQG